VPPRRLVAIVAALAAVGLAVGVWAALAFSSRSRSVAAPVVQQDRPGPVLLVPGYGGSTGALSGLAARLSAAGRDAQVVTLPGGATGDLRDQAKALDGAARTAIARTGSPSVDVVGYSAGGVVARLWVRSYGGDSLARRVVTLGSPHHGTELAGLATALAPDSCPVACQQLAPGSDLLHRLNAGDETPAGPQWVSLWTTDDETVTPPESARLAGALDISLQGICPGVRVSHGELPTAPLAQGIVLAVLAASPAVAPTTGDCARLSVP
jgi:triacylglycerol esterase/lipase EstA (alpha/beta hydrolase family)